MKRGESVKSRRPAVRRTAVLTARPLSRPLPKKKTPVLFWKAGLSLLVISVLYGILWLPFFRITNIVVSGNHLVQTGDVQSEVNRSLAGAYWFGLPRNSVLLYPSGTIEEALFAKFSRLSTVDLFAESSRVLRVTVTEREPKYAWCPKEDNCFFTDDTGVVFTRAPRFSGDVFLDITGSTTPAALPITLLPETQFVDLLQYVHLLDVLTERHGVVGGTLHRVDLQDDGIAAIYFGRGETEWYVTVRQDQLTAESLTELQTGFTALNGGDKSLSENHGPLLYIDARIPHKLFYKFNDTAR